MRPLIRAALLRPITVAALCVVVGGGALAALLRLPVELLPDLRYPALTVQTTYPGAPADEVERAVTVAVEDALGATPGLERIESTSATGVSVIRLEFPWGADMDRALLHVRERVGALGRGLPVGADPPTVYRLDPSDRPLLVIAVRGPGGPAALAAYAADVAARRLEAVPGVAEAAVLGGRQPEVVVVPDPSAMAAFGISMRTLSGTLREAGADLAGGAVREGPHRFGVDIARGASDLASLRALPIPAPVPVRVADVARVYEDAAPPTGAVRVDGSPAVLVEVWPSADANALTVAARVHATLDELRGGPQAATLDVVIDESRYVGEAVQGVTQALWLGGLLATLALWVVVRDLRSLAAVAAALGLSLALAVALFEPLGASVNLISLGGLALGTGLVVDNTIVVMESIARHRAAGRRGFEAALEGASEVGGAVVASTLTTAVVFAPLVLVEGLAGQLFRDQAIAVVLSLAGSLVAALVVVPVLLRPSLGGTEPVDAPPPAPTPDGRLVAAYERALEASLRRRGAVVTATVVLLAVSAAVAAGLPRELQPEGTQTTASLRLTTPAGLTLAAIEDEARAVEETLLAHGDGALVVTRMGSHARPARAGRADLERASTATFTVVGESAVTAAAAAGTRPGVAWEREASQVEALLSAGSGEVAVDLVAGTRPRPPTVETVRRRLAAAPSVAAIRAPGSTAAYDVVLDHDAIQRAWLATADVQDALAVAAGGTLVSTLDGTGAAVPVRLGTSAAGDLEALLRTEVQTPGGPRPLRTLVEVVRREQPERLVRVQREPVARLHVAPAPGTDLAALDADLRAAEQETGLRLEARGDTEAFAHSVRSLLTSLLVSLGLIYLILVAQFESVRLPLLVLVTVPLAVGGVALALAVFGQSVNLLSMTGGVILTGLVVNDAILKIDAFERLRRDGYGLLEAVVEGGRLRLRPVLMTTATTALGLLPMALGWGAGAETRAPLAIAVIGGLGVATTLTLFVVPTLYVLLAPSTPGHAPR